MRGRPQLFANRHAITVIVPKDDYEALRMRAAEAALEHPGFGLADLVRDFIQRGLARDAKKPPRPIDAKSARVRQLRSIARTALELAKSMKTA